ncbi:mental retardation GTPase activating protein homolog 4 isoform X2 [Drosophila pseudoobscura]|uniref:Mental retardation GTPase activating protein homolog 4 isoform X2 n=1 Tax=Drosophila pseudoobscura pseudoobscura TaxID=46245 RepID=A0A6I8VEI3_DROPS|nr:mental retardation GTPase activating protein homolog 4 isoform X2 [Drosophila pseudoobscura]
MSPLSGLLFNCFLLPIIYQQRPAFSASAAKLHSNPKCSDTLAPATSELDQGPTHESPGCGDGDCAAAAAAVPAVTPPPLSAAVEVTVASDQSGTSTTTGCNCFGGKKCKKRWASSKTSDTPEMSEMYCPRCEDPSNETPACLSKMPDKRQSRLKPKTSILSVESELLVGKRSSLRLPADSKRKPLGGSITRSASLSAADRRTSLPVATKKIITPRLRPAKAKDQDKGKEKEKDKNKENDKKSSNQKSNGSTSNFLSKMSPKRLRQGKDKDKEIDKGKTKSNAQSKAEAGNNNNAKTPNSTAPAKTEEYEIADDATSLNGSKSEGTGAPKMAVMSESESKLMISVRGREELPVVESESPKTPSQRFEKFVLVPVEPENHPLQPASPSGNVNDNDELADTVVSPTEVTPMLDVANGNQESSATLPRTSKQAHSSKMLHLVPKRRTPDGTNIYYWCDVPKKTLKELDDGAYNPLWTSRGFTQSFHFWKENRRQQSTPLNAFLTYVTLPWWSIAKDLLDHRETPILTF